MRPSFRRLFPLLLVAAALAGPACGRREKAGEPGSPSAEARRYPLRGVLKQVDAAKSEVTVEHEAISGYMAAMTMSFPIHDDPKVIGILRPGDRIEATLVVDGDRYWLEEILTRGFVPTPAGAVASAAVTPIPNRGIAVGDSVPDFALTDQTGKTVRLSEMRGETVALTFLYTRCPIATACPMTASRFSKLEAMLREKGFGRLLTVTVDPERDTPEVLAKFARGLGADPKRWKFLTGDPKAVAEVASSFGVLYYPERGQIVHAQAVAVVDPKGRLATIYFGEQWQPEHILRDMEKARKG